MRRSITTIAAAILAAAAAFTGTAGAATDSYGTTVAPVNTRTQRLSDRVCAYVIHAGFPVTCPTVYVAADPQGFVRLVGAGALAYADETGTVLSVNTYSLTVLPGPPDPDAVHILTHEVLHRVSAAAPGYPARRWTDPQMWWEEGATEAVTLDLDAGIWRTCWPGYSAIYTGAYPRRVAAVRSASARATHGSWRAYAARAWRARFLRANQDGRSAMLAEVGVRLDPAPRG